MLVGGQYRTDFQLPGTDSQRATDALAAHFAGYGGDRELLVVHASHGVLTDPSQRAAIARLSDQLREVPGVAAVANPIGGSGAEISGDRTTAIGVLRFTEPTDNVPAASLRRALADTNRASDISMTAGLIGQATENAESSSPSASEAVAFLATVAVLLIAFGSVAAVAAAMATAGLALSVGLGAMAVLSHVLAIPTFATQVATTVGLGVGIDYALLVLARYRGLASDGVLPADATAQAMLTSARAVAFAGATVIVAMLGLYVVPLPFVHGMAIGVCVVVVPTILAATTLLPAVLGNFGAYIDRWQAPGLRHRALGGRSPRWAAWVTRVQRRPAIAAGVAAGTLILLAAPALGLHVGNADASTDNAATPAHRAYAYATEAFGPGFTYPFIVVATPHGPVDDAVLQHTVQVTGTVLRDTSGVATLSPPQMSTDRQQVLFNIYPASGPSAPQRAKLLQRLRGPVRAALSHQGVAINVGGSDATSVDLAHAVTHSMPYAFAAVIGISLLLLLVLFRSVVVVAKAGVMNLLSVAAAFGVVVAVFQWGWGLRLLGVDYAGPIEVFLPLLLFPVVFGLSMDYEVFLVSRIRDEWDRTGDNRAAVTEGLATTGRVVTAGAAVMVVLFASLVFASARTVKMFGLAMAVAIALDALVVRSILLPATMQLLGRYNWWLPRWLDARLPHLAAEPARASASPDVGEEPTYETAAALRPESLT
jgi:RND superfamily putative drug exporter